MLLGERPLLQVLLDQRVVGLRDRLHELLARGIRHRVDVVGPLGLLGHRSAGIEIGLLVKQVGDPAELVLLTDGQLEGRDLGAERRHQLVEGALEIGALAVELVHEDRARQALVHGQLPRVLGLDLDTVDRADDDDHGVHRTDRVPEVADEVRGPGRIQRVDLDALPLDRRHGERNGDPAPLLIGIVVGNGIAVFHGPHACDGTGREEQCFEERRLARSSMADQQDVSDVLRVVRLQRGSFR